MLKLSQITLLEHTLVVLAVWLVLCGQVLFDGDERIGNGLGCHGKIILRFGKQRNGRIAKYRVAAVKSQERALPIAGGATKLAFRVNLFPARLLNVLKTPLSEIPHACRP